MLKKEIENEEDLEKGGKKRRNEKKNKGKSENK